MKYALILVLVFSLHCWGQTTRGTGNALTSGPCSPSVTGGHNQFTINCPGISSEERKKILDILNKILADRLDETAVMAKLNEISKAVNPNTITISPDEVMFFGNDTDETYTLRLANETPHDQYQVEVLFTLPRNSVGFEDPEVYVPLASRKPAFDGAVVSDISVFECHEYDGTPDEYLIFSRLTPGEQREIKLRHKAKSAAEVSAQITYSSTTPVSRVEYADSQTQRGQIFLVPLRDCRAAIGADPPSVRPIFMKDAKDW